MVVERMVPDQEVGSSNPLAQTTLIYHSHIDLHRDCFALFNAQNLSRLVNQRLEVKRLRNYGTDGPGWRRSGQKERLDGASQNRSKTGES
jgi:hypothetical protein